MKLRINEGVVVSRFYCPDCGEYFDIPTEDHRCPNCYETNIYQDKITNELNFVDNFYGKQVSVSPSVRDAHPIDDCQCFIVRMDYCFGKSGYWDGKSCNANKDMAVIFSTNKAAREKIEHSGMWEYCKPHVQTVLLIDNHIV